MSSLSKCPACGSELMDVVGDVPKEHGYGYEATEAYLFCATCGRSYPDGFDSGEEA